MFGRLPMLCLRLNAYFHLLIPMYGTIFITLFLKIGYLTQELKTH